MLILIEIILILAIEFNIYHCIGVLIEKINIIPAKQSFSRRLLYGFLTYQMLFWCVALPCTILNKSLSFLTVLWLIVISIIIITAIVLARKEIVNSILKLYAFILKYKWFIIPCLLLHVFLLYYVCTHGRNDIDAWTYIGEITTALETNRIAGIDPVTGYDTAFLFLRYMFSTIAQNSAVLCRIFNIHPLIFCRTVRATINVVLLSFGSFEIFKLIFKHNKEKIEKSIIALILAQSAHFLFINTSYTSARFLIFRGYEGKAYCAGVLVLVTILICTQLFKTNNKKYFILLLIDMIAGMAISTSSVFVLSLCAGGLMAAHILQKKQWSYIPYFIFAMLPNIIFVLLKIAGFAGIQLEV